MNNNFNRRELLLAGSTLLSSSMLTNCKSVVKQQNPIHKPLQTIRVGFVGIGVKGSSHLGNLLRMDNVEIVAVCDVIEQQCVEAQEQAVRLGKPKPNAYFRGDYDFERMCAEEELDLVYTVTPWRWHTPVCLAAMENGSHAATEVPAALTVDECWQLVETSEKTNCFCTMMENVNYQQTEMAIWNMIRKGALGELVYCEAGYMHDTRYLKSHDYGDGLWLAEHHAVRNGSLYPTHGLGPMCWYMDINRGDRFEYLVSMSSNARGLGLYMKEHLPADHPKRNREYKNGDVNVCLIRTANGLSITIKHDTDLPRPYSRRNVVQGTRGIVRGFPKFEVCIEGDTHRHKWESGQAYLEEFKHPLWKKLDDESLGKYQEDDYGAITNGAVWNYNPENEIRGGDFLEDYRLIQALLNGTEPDFNVYDAATWSAVAPLSEYSVVHRSKAVNFPDFTKGKWKSTLPLRIIGV